MEISRKTTNSRPINRESDQQEQERNVSDPVAEAERGGEAIRKQDEHGSQFLLRVPVAVEDASVVVHIPVFSRPLNWEVRREEIVADAWVAERTNSGTMCHGCTPAMDGEHDVPEAAAIQGKSIEG
eukprot:763048-Hanusia_phi.AAC.3